MPPPELEEVVGLEIVLEVEDSSEEEVDEDVKKGDSGLVDKEGGGGNTVVWSTRGDSDIFPLLLTDENDERLLLLSMSLNLKKPGR